MIAGEVLTKGVERGIITADQADRLRALNDAREPLEVPVSPDDEQLRFITGFSDIFVTLGLAMFIGAIGYFAQRWGGRLALWIGIAIVAWLLAQFFTRMRRMALPSIVLLIAFAVSIFMSASLLLGAGATAYYPASLMGTLLGLDSGQPVKLAAAALLTVLLTAVHYWRFRVPVTIAAGCAALTVAIVGLVYGLAPQITPVGYNAVLLVCGLAIFALAMRFDMADPERLTRRTDIAFWLHLLAAPLIVHSLIRELVTGVSKLTPPSAVAIMAVFLVLSFVAIVIDRRAILVSGLSEAGVAFYTLIREAGISDVTTPLTLLALGAFVLLLSAGWRPLRATICGIMPSALTRRLPRIGLQA